MVGISRIGLQPPDDSSDTSMGLHALKTNKLAKVEICQNLKIIPFRHSVKFSPNLRLNCAVDVNNLLGTT